MHIKNKIGTKILPWVTPDLILTMEDLSWWILTYCDRLDGFLWFPVVAHRFFNSFVWGTWSNAFEKSSNIRAVCFWWSTLNERSWINSRSWVAVDITWRKPCWYGSKTRSWERKVVVCFRIICSTSYMRCVSGKLVSIWRHLLRCRFCVRGLLLAFSLRRVLS